MSHVWRLCQRQIFEVMSYQEKKSLSNLIVRKSVILILPFKSHVSQKLDHEISVTQVIGKTKLSLDTVLVL